MDSFVIYRGYITVLKTISEPKLTYSFYNLLRCFIFFSENKQFLPNIYNIVDKSGVWKNKSSTELKDKFKSI